MAAIGPKRKQVPKIKKSDFRSLYGQLLEHYNRTTVSLVLRFADHPLLPVVIVTGQTAEGALIIGQPLVVRDQVVAERGAPLPAHRLQVQLRKLLFRLDEEKIHCQKLCK